MGTERITIKKSMMCVSGIFLFTVAVCDRYHDLFLCDLQQSRAYNNKSVIIILSDDGKWEFYTEIPVVHLNELFNTEMLPLQPKITANVSCHCLSEDKKHSTQDKMAKNRHIDEVNVLQLHDKKHPQICGHFTGRKTELRSESRAVKVI